MLTTKDGFCDTLRSLHLPLAELWPFTFPCWILPRDLSPLAQRLQEAAEAPEPEEAAASALPAASMSTLVGASGLWILKPARGSQGEGIKLLNRSSVLELARKAPEGVPPLPDDVLYRRGKTSTFCTLVLSGKLVVLAGKDAFRAEAGPWTVLGAEALNVPEGDYIPDFTAYIESDHVRVVRVPLKEIEDARRRHDEGTGGGAADATTEEDVGVGENGGATKKRPGLGMRQPSQRTLQQQRRAARAVARRADAKRRPTKDASRADCETDTEHPGEETIRQPSPRSRSMPPARFLDAVTRRSRKEDKKSLLTAEDSDLTDVERGRGDSTSDVDGPVKNGNDRADFGAVQMRENPASALRRPSGVPGFPATDPLGRQPTVDVTVSDDDAPDM